MGKGGKGQINSLGQKYTRNQGFPGGSSVKNLPIKAGDVGLIPGFDPWVGKIPWRKAW